MQLISSSMWVSARRPRATATVYGCSDATSGFFWIRQRGPHVDDLNRAQIPGLALEEQIDRPLTGLMPSLNGPVTVDTPR